MKKILKAAEDLRKVLKAPKNIEKSLRGLKKGVKSSGTNRNLFESLNVV